MSSPRVDHSQQSQSVDLQAKNSDLKKNIFIALIIIGILGTLLVLSIGLASYGAQPGQVWWHADGLSRLSQLDSIIFMSSSVIGVLIAVGGVVGLFLTKKPIQERDNRSTSDLSDTKDNGDHTAEGAGVNGETNIREQSESEAAKQAKAKKTEAGKAAHAQRMETLKARMENEAAQRDARIALEQEEAKRKAAVIERAAADKLAAEKAAEQKVATERAALDKLAAERAAEQKAATERAAADREAEKQAQARKDAEDAAKAKQEAEAAKKAQEARVRELKNKKGCQSTDIQNMTDAQLSAKNFPAEDIVAIIQTTKDFDARMAIIQRYFPTYSSSSAAETKRRLQLMDTQVIKILGNVLPPEHIKMLSDDQLASEDFPAAEIVSIVKAKKNLAEQMAMINLYFPTTQPSDASETKRQLQLMHTKVIKALGSVLQPDHIKLLSDDQLASKDFPAEEIVAIISAYQYQVDRTDMIQRYFPTGVPFESETQRRLLLMDAKVIESLKSVFTLTHLRLIEARNTPLANTCLKLWQEEIRKAWVMIPSQKELQDGKQPKIAIGSIALDGEFKIHISVDPAQMPQAIPLVLSILHQEGAPEVALKFQTKSMLSGIHQIGKEFALMFSLDLDGDRDRGRIKTIEKILTQIEHAFQAHDIKREKGMVLTADNRKHIEASPEGEQVLEKANIESRKYDKRILGSRYFHYRHENFTAIADSEEWATAMSPADRKKQNIVLFSEFDKLIASSPRQAHNPTWARDPFENIEIGKSR